MTVSFGITVETITKLSYKFQQKKIYILITHLTKALVLNTEKTNCKKLEND